MSKMNRQRKSNKEKIQIKKKRLINYAYVSAICCQIGISLEWADLQTWSTLFHIFNEYSLNHKAPQKKEKIKATKSQIQNMIV